MGAPWFTSAAALFTLRGSLSFSVSSLEFPTLWRQREDLFMTKLPVVYTVSDTGTVGRKEGKKWGREAREGGRKEEKTYLAFRPWFPNTWLWTLHKFFNLPSLGFLMSKMQIISNCIVVNYLKNAMSYKNWRDYYFESNNECNNHLRIKLDIINMES